MPVRLQQRDTTVRVEQVHIPAKSHADGPKLRRRCFGNLAHQASIQAEHLKQAEGDGRPFRSASAPTFEYISWRDEWHADVTAPQLAHGPRERPLRAFKLGA